MYDTTNFYFLFFFGEFKSTNVLFNLSILYNNPIVLILLNKLLNLV
jgi:hypothetical protein